MSKKEVKKVPELRFKSFTDDWEQRKLEEILHVNSGKDYKHLDKGNIPVYGTGGYMLSVNESLSSIDAIGIGRKGTIDKPQYLKAPFWTVDTLFYMLPKQSTDLLFLFALTQKVNWKKLDESTGVPSLSKININRFKTNFPSIIEQEKIGKFFKHLDKTINLHQRKLEKLKKLKESYLSNLLPKHGETSPAIRFISFKKKWKQCKLDHISNSIISGGTPSTKCSEYWKGNIPWIQSSDLVEHNVSSPSPNKFINHTSIDESSAKLIPRDSIGVVTRVGVGKLALFDYQYATSQDFISFKELNIDKYFALYILYKLLQKERKYLQGTSIKGITKNDLLLKQITIPDTGSEQTKIGKFLKSIDKSINLHQDKIDKLKDIKKVYLQKLFV